MTKLSININKVALIRNARGANYPDLIDFARRCEQYGAQGITVHPRPDQRHIRYDDLLPLRSVVQTELNIEGYPSEEFVTKVLEAMPDQVTLVPDPPGALTSDSGWDTGRHQDFLRQKISKFRERGIRVSIFLNPDPSLIDSAVGTGADRIELYTGDYAHHYGSLEGERQLGLHVATAQEAHRMGLGVNAGHDLNLDNLRKYALSVPHVDEVSIGHALVVDALEYGLKNAIFMYLRDLDVLT